MQTFHGITLKHPSDDTVAYLDVTSNDVLPSQQINTASGSINLPQIAAMLATSSCVAQVKSIPAHLTMFVDATCFMIFAARAGCLSRWEPLHEQIFTLNSRYARSWKSRLERNARRRLEAGYVNTPIVYAFVFRQMQRVSVLFAKFTTSVRLPDAIMSSLAVPRVNNSNNDDDKDDIQIITSTTTTTATADSTNNVIQSQTHAREPVVSNTTTDVETRPFTNRLPRKRKFIVIGVDADDMTDVTFQTLLKQLPVRLNNWINSQEQRIEPSSITTSTTGVTSDTSTTLNSSTLTTRRSITENNIDTTVPDLSPVSEA